MISKIDLLGRRFGRLIVIEFAGRTRHGSSYWNCLCDCGNTSRVIRYNLITGTTKSCGCLKRELTSIRSIKHGQTLGGVVSELCKLHYRIKERCYYNKAISYPHYGGRGIHMYPEWLDTKYGVKNFCEYITTSLGLCPKGMTLDRIDNNGNYEPGNLRWATRKEQHNNMSSNHVIEYNGESLTLTQWSERLGIKQPTLRHRLNRLGWSIERALTTPVHRGRSVD